MLYKESSLQLFFGNAATSYSLQELDTIASTITFQQSEPLKTIATIMTLEHSIILKQLHSNNGYVIDSPDHDLLTQPYLREGDYLVTNQPNVGIGITTADCLPLVLFDHRNKIIAVAHAGWRGSVNQIAIKAVQAMQAMGATLNDIKVFFGASAKACCYRVDDNFRQYFAQFCYADTTFLYHDNALFFDLTLFNRLQLESIGINAHASNLTYNSCTICSLSHCSYRRDGNQARRQLTFASII